MFSENYEQHQKNVARLRVIERGETPPADSPAAAPAADGAKRGRR